MLAARLGLLVPALLVVLGPRAARADDPVPWQMPYHHRPPVVIPEEEPPRLGAPGVVYLHVETEAPRLELRIFDGMSYLGPPGTRHRSGHVLSRRICLAPCDQIVDARKGARYFFHGPGLVSSDLFRLNDRAGPLTARVVAGSRRTGKAAGLAGVFGLGAVLAGGMLLGLSRVDPHDRRATTTAGAVLLPSGAVLVAVAAALASKATTTVRWSLPVPP